MRQAQLLVSSRAPRSGSALALGSPAVVVPPWAIVPPVFVPPALAPPVFVPPVFVPPVLVPPPVFVPPLSLASSTTSTAAALVGSVDRVPQQRLTRAAWPRRPVARNIFGCELVAVEELRAIRVNLAGKARGQAAIAAAAHILLGSFTGDALEVFVAPGFTTGSRAPAAKKLGRSRLTSRRVRRGRRRFSELSGHENARAARGTRSLSRLSCTDWVKVDLAPDSLVRTRRNHIEHPVGLLVVLGGLSARAGSGSDVSTSRLQLFPRAGVPDDAWQLQLSLPHDGRQRSLRPYHERLPHLHRFRERGRVAR